MGIIKKALRSGKMFTGKRWRITMLAKAAKYRIRVKQAKNLGAQGELRQTGSWKTEDQIERGGFRFLFYNNLKSLHIFTCFKTYFIILSVC
jgi:hypothetical protein